MNCLVRRRIYKREQPCEQPALDAEALKSVEEWLGRRRHSEQVAKAWRKPLKTAPKVAFWARLEPPRLEAAPLDPVPGPCHKHIVGANDNEECGTDVLLQLVLPPRRLVSSPLELFEANFETDFG